MRSTVSRKSNDAGCGELTLNIEYSRLALRLRTLRLAKNLTVEQVAKECQMDSNELYDYERDKKVPSIEVLNKLYKYYGV